MTKAEVEVAAISMDLKRVALGYHRKSFAMAQRFSEEAIQNANKTPKSNLKPYVVKILNNLKTILNSKDKDKVAEDALMYSTILQNSVIYRNNKD